MRRSPPVRRLGLSLEEWVTEMHVSISCTSMLQLSSMPQWRWAENILWSSSSFYAAFATYCFLVVVFGVQHPTVLAAHAVRSTAIPVGVQHTMAPLATFQPTPVPQMAPTSPPSPHVPLATAPTGVPGFTWELVTDQNIVTAAGQQPVSRLAPQPQPVAPLFMQQASSSPPMSRRRSRSRHRREISGDTTTPVKSRRREKSVGKSALPTTFSDVPIPIRARPRSVSRVPKLPINLDPEGSVTAHRNEGLS
jgi:hypothetical protein